MAIKFFADHKGKFYEYKTEYGCFQEYDNLVIHDHPHKVLVFLPTFYDKKKSGGYPVVYMNDGNTAFEPGGLSQWSWEVDKTICSLCDENIITPVIVVAVYPKNRALEYLDIKRWVDPATHILFRGGGISEYSDFMANDLRPFIDDIYNTAPASDKTMIVGSSFGGIASFHTACIYPDSFGMAGVMSPSFEVYAKKGDVDHVSFTHDVEDSLIKNKTKKPKLWLDWGKLEPLAPKLTPEVIQILIDDFGYTVGKNLFCMEDPLGTHDERAWAYRFRLVMENFYSKK
jgi:predicted alpha/beta superfamily hydrolase